MDATEIERLVVRLTGDGSQYFKTLQQAQAATAKFEDGMVVSLTTIKTAFRTALAVATTNIIVKTLQRTAEEMENVGHMADRLNVTTEELIALGHAAEQSDLDIGALNRSLTLMQRQLSNSARGGKEATEMFE